MLDVNQLPVPDWGLHCPRCGLPLAGMREHRCARCGEPFSLAAMLARIRPIPDLGLACPECSYLLTGLTTDRCPECGTPFSLIDLLEEDSTPDLEDVPPATESANDAHIKKREPRFTGTERPLPQWGLKCAACGRPLAGAPANHCPKCGASFNLEKLRGDCAWVDINEYLPIERGIWASAEAQAALYEAQVPYLILGGLRSRGPGRSLLVPREFLFDALNCLATITTSTTDAPANEWPCPACGEFVPGRFERCWHCGAARSTVEP